MENRASLNHISGSSLPVKSPSALMSETDNPFIYHALGVWNAFLKRDKQSLSIAQTHL
jgi:hypothetical protein